MIARRFGLAALLGALLLGGTACGVQSAESVENAGDPIKADEQLLLFPAPCRETGDGWVADVHGWLYEAPMAEFDAAATWLFGNGLEPASPEEETLFRQRLRWFLVDSERGKALSVSIAGQAQLLPATEPNGHVHATVGLASGCDAAAEITATAADGRRFSTILLPLAREGISVISDIDDTIKISEVHDKQALLANTFLKPYAAAPGMAALYQAWARDHGASFHYLSASPWQLYVPLSEFMAEAGLPAGSFHLKHFRLKDESFFDLFADPFEYKLALIEDLLARLPKRRFVLVGDSGELDPEVYGEIARRHPDRIIAIVIREVASVAPAEAEARYAKAFDGLPATLAHRFVENPQQFTDLNITR